MMARKKIQWTSHAQFKLKQYGLSKIKLIGILYRPERKESGIVPGTAAVMKTNSVYSGKSAARKKAAGAAGYKKPPGEIWLMYQDAAGVRKIISCWRYPGASKPGDPLPIPRDILSELSESDI
jgi:hypothetical protein